MSHNIHFDFPPIMEDGRNYATYIPACEINEKIQSRNGLSSNYAYRQYLIKNATNLMKTNQLVACDDTGPCMGQFNRDPIANSTKHIYRGYSDSSTPYGYETSNMKQLYLSRMQLEARKDAPVLTQEQYLTNK